MTEICQQMLSELDAAVLEGIDYELRIVNGPPARALIDVALHVHAMAIVIGTRRAPPRLGQRTIRSELEAGPVPVVALVGPAERESHPLAEQIDDTYRHGYDSFPASDPPSTWAGRPALTSEDAAFWGLSRWSWLALITVLRPGTPWPWGAGWPRLLARTFCWSGPGQSAAIQANSRRFFAYPASLTGG